MAAAAATTTITIPHRFFDADEEPTENLAPIKGYESSPLVSLKEAVKPIKSLLPDLDSMVQTALRNCREPKDGLTQDESASIHIYTMQWPEPHPSLFTLLNRNLRLKNRISLTPWFLFLKLLFTALYKLPSFEGIVWRGVRGDLSKHYKATDHIWWGFSSCTENLEIIEKFMPSKTKRTVFNIECKTGKYIRSHSHFQDENEILLLPGTYFRAIGKIEIARGVSLIHLRESNPPYMTIALPFNDSTDSNRSKFKQECTIVAGGTVPGKKQNPLSFPDGIFIDEKKTIFIVDRGNNRVVQWKWNAKDGETIAGGNGKGNKLDQLNYPIDVTVDKQNYSIIISDRDNSRVIRWLNDERQDILIENIKCCGLTIDRKGFLYTSDSDKHEVRRWRIEEMNKGSALMAGGNGKGNQLNQLDYPTFIFVDEEQSIYISDCGNHRVMKWKKNTKEGIVVAGGNGQGNHLNQFSFPAGVIVDQLGQIYVSDLGNDRVMQWREGDQEGSVVAGGRERGNQLDQLFHPRGLSFDLDGNLYVSDRGNHRVVQFEKLQ